MKNTLMGLVKTPFILSLLLLLLAAAGCSRPETPRYRIGVSQCSDDAWRDKMNQEILREALFYEDAEVEILTADDDNAKQIADIEYFINEEVDAIVVAPNQAEAITPVLKKAYDKGIPVIVFDRGVIGDSYTSFIEFDNKGIGESAGRYAAAVLPPGSEVVELRGLDGSTPAVLRHKGFSEALAGHPAIRTVASVDGIWKEKRAEAIMDSLIDIYPGVDLVYAHNDLMAIGAANALRKRGMDNVIILGTDAAPDLGMKAVADSVIDATFIYPTDGQRIMQTTMAILQGEPYERFVKSPALPPVDRHNADILLRQEQLLKDETAKILLLEEKNGQILDQSRSQRSNFYLTIILAAAFALIILMLLWLVSQRIRSQKLLKEKNAQLEAERDKQQELYRQLDGATKSKIAFFTNVSHDLRTPLTLIAEPLAQLSSRKDMPPHDRMMLDVAEKNVGILRRLIDQILDFQRFEAGQAVLNLTEVSLADLTRDWVESFRSVAAKRNIRIDLDLQCDGTPTVAVDVEKLRRVFFNLLSNAFKYSPDNSVITLDGRINAKECVMKISDTGIGISEEDQRRIFDRFYQVDEVRPKGSGIGLSLAKAFIELHGGSITLESSPGKGSTFTITIPTRHLPARAVPSGQVLISGESGLSTVQGVPRLDERPAADPELQAQAELELSPLESEAFISDDSKPLLLVIDDNQDIRNLIARLTAGRYNVIAAADGRQGIRLASKYIPDVIICDIMMPGMDGLECCRILKEEVPTSHIPVLMLTACALDEQRLQSYESGADGYLSKPFDTAMLLSRLQNLIDNRRRIKNVYQSGVPLNAQETADLLPDFTDTPSIDSDFFREFDKIMKEVYADSSVTTDLFARRLGLGPAQLTRKIKALTNYSPIELLRNYRLQVARNLIISTEKNISEIAYETGFSSPAYLTKCFRDTFKETPSDLRAKVGRP